MRCAPLEEIRACGDACGRHRSRTTAHRAAQGPPERPGARPACDGPGDDHSSDGALGTWSIEQILANPDGHDAWYLEVPVDLAASADAGDVVATFDGLRRR